MKQLILIVLSLTLFSCGTDTETQNNFKEGNYHFEIKNCDFPLDNLVEKRYSISKLSNKLVLKCFGICPQEKHYLESKSEVIIKKDTIKLNIQYIQDYYGIWETAVTACTCLNIHTFNFDEKIDTSSVIDIYINKKRMVTHR